MRVESRECGRRSLLALVAVSSLVAGSGAAVTVEKGEYVVITVRQGQSLREIAKEYLDDPNLWTEILKLNKLASPDNVKPGTKLQIPKSQVSLANHALSRSGETIMEASGLGAKVFAPKILEGAVDLRNQALVEHKGGKWTECFGLATKSQGQAAVALEKTKGARSSSGQAVLSNFSGTVQRRQPSDQLWRDSTTGSILVEREKLRTLSSSQAEVLFIDESKLRLGANSQATIEKMRVDKLSNRQDASVSLVEGDIYALLGGSGKGRQLAIDVPGVSEDSGSRDFWVGRKGGTTKVANYDEEAMVVASGGSTVTLQRNQGALLAAGIAPVKRDLLSAPRLVLPEDEHEDTKGRITFSWEPVRGARSYRVDVSPERSFRSLHLLGKAGSALATGTSSTWEVPAALTKAGVFFWRVAAIDGAGFPGPASSSRAIRVRGEVGSRYLVVRSPADRSILRSSPAAIEGSVGTGCRLAIAGKPVEVGADGSFRVEWSLEEGTNTVVLGVEDQGGKKYERSLSATYMPDRPAPISYGEDLVALGAKRFVTRGGFLLLRGRTTPGARVDVESVGTGFTAGSIAATSEPPGEFRVLLAVDRAEEEFRLLVTALSGFVTEDRFKVVRDDDPPVLSLSTQTPTSTAEQRLTLRGRVEGGTSLSMNGAPLPLENGGFEANVELTPGLNRIELVARDDVGNEARIDRAVLADRSAPKLLSASLSRSRATGGGPVEIIVRASDESGLNRTAAFAVTAGKFFQAGTLLLDRGTSTYRGEATFPLGANEPIELTYVVLEDELSNSATTAVGAEALVAAAAAPGAKKSPRRKGPGTASRGR